MRLEINYDVKVVAGVIFSRNDRGDKQHKTCSCAMLDKRAYLKALKKPIYLLHSAALEMMNRNKK
jgi:hypothetical protein